MLLGRPEHSPDDVNPISGCQTEQAQPEGFERFAGDRLHVLWQCLRAGHLGLLEHALQCSRTAWPLEHANAGQLREVAAIREGLTIRLVEEAAAGGPGSLVIPDDRATVIIERQRRPLPQLVRVAPQ